MRARRSRQRTAIIAVVVLPGCLPAAASQAASLDGGRKVVTSASGAHWLDLSYMAKQDRMDELASAVDALAALRDPQFAFVVVNSDRNELVVYRAAADPAEALSLYQSVIPNEAGVSLRFEAALLSKEQENKLTDQLNAAIPALSPRKIELTAWGVREPGGPFVISFDPEGDTLTADVLQSIAGTGDSTLAKEFFDSKLVQFRAQNSIVPLTRSSDTSPFYGGRGFTDRHKTNSGLGAVMVSQRVRMAIQRPI